MTLSRAGLLLCLYALAGVSPVATAQSSSRPDGPALDGPAAPAAPAVAARDSEGRVTIRATRLTESIVVDGRLDDAVYGSVRSIGDFVQQEPVEGEPATERTEVWLLFDDRNIYVSARCWDSQPDRQVANEMRRDGQGVIDNESFGVMFDTFYDRRNGFIFYLSLAGGMTDGYITDERELNRDWNTVWDARTARFGEGWTTEMVIPFKSLRFKPGQAQVWGINFRRIVRWKNETSYLTRIPAALGRRGINKISSAAALVGVTPPASSRNFEVKPYGITDLTTDRTTNPPTSNDPGADAGFDIKAGLTDGLTADFTYNTDFAQVEDDEQQVNLTRFSVLFPEKRDFFLEGQGIFGFGGLQNMPRAGTGGGPGLGMQSNPNPNDVPILFFSRRIGLTGGHEVPIDVGGRLAGKAGPYSIGLLDIRTGDRPAFGIRPTNFGGVRIKRDILRRSSVGVLATHRSITSSGHGSNQAFGIDGVFSFYENLNINTYVAKTQTSGVTGKDVSYRAQLDYNADRYGLQLDHLLVDDHFNPQVGFLRRSAFRRNSAYLRFSPRPASIEAVRKFIWDSSFDYITDTNGRLESRVGQAAFRTEFESGKIIGIEYTRNYELLVRPFEISSGVILPVGGYSFPELRISYLPGPQGRITGTVNIERGSFYNGTRTGINTNRPRIELTSQLSLEPGISINWVDLPVGQFTTTLLTMRPTYTVSPRMLVSALLQYTSGTHSLGTNVRFRWEYRPGSDFYVVYSDNRETLGPRLATLQNRGIVVKLTRLFRM